jgi:hypothetical protein
MYIFFISDVSHDSTVVTEEKPDCVTLGFTDDNKSWLKPVTKKKKGEQFLGSDGEEAQSDSEGSVMGREVQSDSEGSVMGGEVQSDSEGNGEEALTDSEGTVVGREAQWDSEGSAGEEMLTDPEGSVAEEEVQSGSEGSVEGEEEMSLDEDENYKVRKFLTQLIFTS